MKQFYHVLINTLIANVTTSYLWFALVFWVYLETRSVLATGIIGGAYMLLIALFSMIFGTIVDRHKKKNVMVAATVVTFTAYAIAGAIFLIIPTDQLVSWLHPGFWLFGGIILIGAVVENMRNIALSTTVTLLVPAKKRANANGLVGTVQGLAFMVTSVFSGLSIGLLGMGWTLAIAIGLTGFALLHLSFIKIKEDHIVHDPELDTKKIDIKGSIAAIKVVPGLFALIIFTTFNNLIGGVYMALMDPYGLTLFSVEWWGVILGATSTGFIIGGLLVAKFGLGKNPIRTLLLANIAMGVIGALFTVREWWPLFAIGMFVYMILFPIIEAAEQTTIQKVVPFKKQGRVFGFAQSIEAAAAPITSFLIAPIAEFFIIPYLSGPIGQAQFSGLLGTGNARGIALVFLVAGAIMVIIASLVFTSRSYKKLSSFYNTIPDPEPSK